VPQPGRPKIDTAPPVDYPALTPEQIALIAPLNANGQPNLYNYMPTRMIPLPEAQARGWTYFYDARTCLRGHQAPYFVSNINLCVDCKRLSKGKQTIGGKAGGGNVRREYKRSEPVAGIPGAGVPGAVVVKQQEPDRLEKQFLVAYAATKDFDRACAQVGVTGPHMQGRLSWSSVFRLAVADLENRLGIVHVPMGAENYEWNEDKYFRLIEVYVDTGMIATARESIGVTPSEFYREMKRNGEFATRLMEAEPLALNALEEKAYQLAANGNDKLLQKILSAKKPEYRESVKIDMKVEERLTDEQLRSETARILASVQRGRIIDSTATSVDEPPRLTQAASDGEGTESAGTAESYSDLL
jgi:hypothetical protein